MIWSSSPPKKLGEPSSFSVILLILGICFVILGIGIPYMYHESNMAWPPYLWFYMLLFIIGVVLIGVNAKKIDEERKKKETNKK